MAKICYKNNFLKQVIVKMEFAQPLSDLTPDSIVSAVAEIKKRFPISEQATGIQQGIEISDVSITSTKSEFPEWNFHGSDRSKSVKINPHFLQILLTKYKSEDDFKDDLVAPIKHIIESRPNTLISRTGVRFVNVFDFDIDSFQKVTEYFTDSISGHIASISNQEACVRTFLINEYIDDEIKIRMQSGFFNPDYPAVIKRRHFVLDIDAYIDFPHTISDVTSYFVRFHKIIQSIFESHITQKLRDEVLNG